MGYRLDLFMNEISPELICSICLGVFCDPVLLNECQHFFCRKCIVSVVDFAQKCPLDDKPIDQSSIKKPFPFIVLLLNNLRMKCRFSPDCDIFRLGLVAEHEFNCLFNPENNITCDKYCNIPLNLSTKDSHDCISYFKDRIKELELENQQLKQTVDELRANEAAREQNSAINEARQLQPVCSNTANKNRKQIDAPMALQRLNHYIKTIESFEMPAQWSHTVWNKTPYIQLLVKLIQYNPNVVAILEKVNLSDFFYYKKYSPDFSLERFKRNSSLFLHVFLFELIEPFINCNSNVLILDCIDNGLAQWIACKARWVTAAVDPIHIESLRLSTRKLRIGRKIGYVPHKRGLNKLYKEIKRFGLDYDFIISFSLNSDGAVEYIFQKLSTNGEFLSFNRDSLKFYSWAISSSDNPQLHIVPLLRRHDLMFFLPLSE